MRRLFALAAFLLPASLYAQGQLPWTNLANAWTYINGGSNISIVDYNASQTQGTYLAAPCAPSGDGPPTFRVFCATDNLILKQATTPGSAQTTANFNIDGKGIAGNFEVPSAGAFKGTALGQLIVTSTDGRLELAKATPDGTGTLTFGCGSGSSCGAINGTSTGQGYWSFANGTAAEWNTIGGIRNTTFLKNNAGSPYTLTLNETFLRCDTSAGAVTLNLPAAAGTYHQYTVKKSSDDVTACTIHPSGTNTIDGLNADVVLTNRYDWITITDISTAGMHWQVTGGNVWQTLGGTTSGANVAGMTTQTLQGAKYIEGQASELLTLSTSGLTTDTTNNLLPAGAIIDAVVVRITTTITTTTNWAVGDPTSSARFCSANATKSSGTTSVCMNQWDGSLATTLALSPPQAAAAKVRITCTGSNPGAGAIRITVFYRQFVAPTS